MELCGDKIKRCETFAQFERSFKFISRGYAGHAGITFS